VAAQFHGAGKILNATFGIDARYGILIGAIVVVGYTLMGGFLAVAWTDVVQGLLMTAVAVVLPVVGVFHLGGLDALWDSLSGSTSPGFLTMEGGKFGSAFLFGVVVANLSWGFGYLGQPHLLTRYMAIRRTRELRQGGLIAMGWVLVSYWGAPFIGIVGLAVLGPGLADQEQVMPLLAKALMPGWLAGIMISGATAAMMSTADSQLLVATSAVVEDVYVRLFRPRATPGRLVLFSRSATVALAGVALWLALAWSEVIYDTVAYAWTGLGASFGPPLVLSLWWRRTTRWGALAGMSGGMAATVAWQNSTTLNDVLDIKAAAVLISAALAVCVSLWTGSRATVPHE
jgi:sodium/proline symporter